MEKDKRQNKPIPEENEEEKSPNNKKSQNLTITDNTLKTPLSVSSVSMNTTQKKDSKSSAMNAASSSNYSVIFKSDKEWLNIEQWDKKSSILKKTYQFNLFKVKMYESFESLEDGQSLIWKNLIKFPTNKMKFFPLYQYLQIWNNLTHSQKEEQYANRCQKLDRPCIQLISQLFTKQRKILMRDTEVQQANGSIGGFNFTSPKKNIINDETLFQRASIDYTYIQKKEEQKKQRQSNLQNKSTNSKNNEEESPFVKSQSIIVQNETTSKQDFSEKVFIEIKKKNMMMRKSSQQLDPLNDQKDKYKQSPLSAKSKPSNPFTFPPSDSPNDSKTPLKKNQSTPEAQYKGTRLSGKRKNSKKRAQNDSDLNKNHKEKKFKISIMKNPQQIVGDLLKSMINFWKRNSIFVKNPGKFDEEKVERIQKELQMFDSQLEVMKTSEPDFNEKDEISKQVFFLNLFNFLVLYNLSILMISNPQAVEKLTNYNMWQAFLISSKIKLGQKKINAYTIMHSILRHNQQIPNITSFMLITPAIEFPSAKYQVRQPNILLAFGFYLPLKKMPHLKVFNIKYFHEDLLATAQVFLIDRIKLKSGSLFMCMPKFMEWYALDFSTSELLNLLIFVHHDIFQKGSMIPFDEQLDKIYTKAINLQDIIVEYSFFNWQFKPLKLKEYFKEV